MHRFQSLTWAKVHGHILIGFYSSVHTQWTKRCNAVSTVRLVSRAVAESHVRPYKAPFFSSSSFLTQPVKYQNRQPMVIFFSTLYVLSGVKGSTWDIIVLWCIFYIPPSHLIRQMSKYHMTRKSQWPMMAILGKLASYHDLWLAWTGRWQSAGFVEVWERSTLQAPPLSGTRLPNSFSGRMS